MATGIHLAFRSPDTAALLCKVWIFLYRNLNERRRISFPPAVHKFIGVRTRALLRALRDFHSSLHLPLFMRSLTDSIALREGILDFMEAQGDIIVISAATKRSVVIVSQACTILSAISPELHRLGITSRIEKAVLFVIHALQDFPWHDGVAEFACLFLRKILNSDTYRPTTLLNANPHLPELVQNIQRTHPTNPQVNIVASQLYCVLTTPLSIEKRPISHQKCYRNGERVKKITDKQKDPNKKRSTKMRISHKTDVANNF